MGMGKRDNCNALYNNCHNRVLYIRAPKVEENDNIIENLSSKYRHEKEQRASNREQRTVHVQT